MEWIIRVAGKDDKVISVEEAGDLKVLETEGGKLYLSWDNLDEGIGDDKGVIANVVDITGYRDYKGILIKFIKDTGLTIYDCDIGDGGLFDESDLDAGLFDESDFDNIDIDGGGYDKLDESVLDNIDNSGIINLDDDFVGRYK